MHTSSLRSLTAAATSAALFAVSGPAMAESASCWIKPFVSPSCDTETVKANPSGHFVFFEVSPNAHYKVKDEYTRVVVASGSAGIRGKRGTIFGLYGNEYKLYIGNPFIGGYGYISNQ